MKRKDPETAVLDYTEAVRLAPEVAAFYSTRAKAYRQLDRHEIADVDAVKAVELEGAQFGAKTPDRIVLGILNYRAVSLPQPSYPTFPPDLHESGDVEFAVEVSETGQVTKAWIQDAGKMWFRETGVAAAERARFKPLLVNGQPAKFTGLVRYTFTAPKQR
jgi:TonB family protein